MAADQLGYGEQRIAVIGMAGRFPGATTIDAFWDNLVRGVESITRYPGPGEDSAGHVPAWGALHHGDWFDAGFFGYSPTEALIVDPQQRGILECAWEALEDAGHDPARHPGAIGVYAGGSGTAYLSLLRSQRSRLAAVTDLQLRLGTSVDLTAPRVAYKLGLRGPAISVQTACSSSLVAIHLACQALLAGECDMALAGGASVRVPPALSTAADAGYVAPDGRCRAFDAAAGGTVFGDAIALVVLRPLHRAVADGDHVRAVVLGSAVGNDGADKVGFTAPSVDGQARTVRTAHVVAEIDPETITYVEAHGTGTPLGDPIEVRALDSAFRAATDRRHFCRVGSVKTNIGHADAAAGAVGFVKTVLALEHGQLPPSLHFRDPNPLIDFADSALVVNAELREWRLDGAFPRRAGVNAAGIGGTNAHVVLEEAPPAASPASSRREQLLVISAQTRSALEATAARLVEHLERRPDLNLADLAWTLQVGRTAHCCRQFVVCAGGDEACVALTAIAGGRTAWELETPGRPVAFLFPGEARPYPGMGRALYRHEPGFRRRVDRCSGLLEAEVGLDLRDVLRPAPDAAAASRAADRLAEPRVARLALFVVEYALAGLWERLGVRPVAAIGRGVGELAAACVAGELPLVSALRAAAEPGFRASRRGRTIPLDEALAGAPAGGGRVLLALGPRPAGELSARAQGLDTIVPGLPAAGDEVTERAVVLRAVGELWRRAAPIEWTELHAGERRRRLSLPTYPFERRRYLVGHDLPAIDSDSAPPLPESDVQRSVMALFAEVLGADPTAVCDDFFDLGGDSVLAMQLVSLVQARLRVSLPAKSVYEAPTVAEFAGVVAATALASQGVTDG